MQFVDPGNAQMSLPSMYGPTFINHHNYASVQNPSLIAPSSSAAAASTSTPIPNNLREFQTSATNNQLNGNVSPRPGCVASTPSQVSTNGIICQINMTGTGNIIRQVGYCPHRIYSNIVPQGTSSPSFTCSEQELNLLANSSEMSGQVSSSCNYANPTVTSSYAGSQTNNFRVNQSVDQTNTKAFLLRQKQCLLMMVHHAMVCRKKEPCEVQMCAKFKKLLEHAVECKSKTCTKKCSITKNMVKHITGCHDPMCQFCGPVRQAILNKGARIDKDESNRDVSGASDEPEPKRVRTDGLLCNVGTDMKTGHDTKEVSDGESTKELRAQSVTAKELGCSINESTKEPKVESVKNVYSFVNYATTETGIKSEMDEKSAKEDKVNTAELVAIGESDNEDGTEPVEQVKDGDSFNSISEDGMIVELAKNEDCCANETMEETTNQTVRGASLLDTFTPEEINVHLSSLRLCEEKTQVTNEQEHVLQVEDQNTCSLCGKEELLFAPPARYCGKCSVLIPSQGVYYCTGKTGNKDREFVSSVPISLCSKCYNVSGELVKLLSGDTPKVCFEKRFNYAQTDADSEWWVQCSKCEAWQHQICALFNGRRNRANMEYTCATCFLKEIENGKCKSLVPIKVLGAHDLPRTMLSDHIEKWLFTHLEVERGERAANLGKKVEEVPQVEGLCVRVVSSVDRVAYVKRNFQEFLKDENYPSEFPYKSKAIVLFQKIEGVDVCLFVMYVQEYGSQCPLPNQRHTYISYIDSVKYFRPDVKLKTSTGVEALRTFVYHGILIAYLDYCKKRGFTSCSLWACPPMKHDDYILYCHPASQRMPKDEKLRAWYQAMIAKALKENVVVERTNLYDYYLIPANNWKTSVSAAHLPYCDNDFWPEQAEVILSGSQKKETEPKGRAMRAAKRGLMDGKPDDIMLLHKLGERMRSMKDNFILMYLQPTCKHCRRAIVSGTRWICTSCKNFLLCDQCYNEEEELPSKDKHPANSKLKHEFQKVNELALPATDDPDPCRECEFFDSRIDLLRLCQTKLYQFDTLRRAKHSTMMILHHLHTPACSSCHTELEPDDISWQCPTCPGYYLCSSCYRRGVWESAHDHGIIRLGEKVTDAVMETHIENADHTKLTLRQALETLSHASQCEARCNHKFCRRMKMLFWHGVRCKVRQTGGCLNCKKVWFLLKLHSCSCEDQDCKISRCKEIKDHFSKLYRHSAAYVDVKNLT